MRGVVVGSSWALAARAWSGGGRLALLRLRVAGPGFDLLLAAGRPAGWVRPPAAAC